MKQLNIQRRTLLRWLTGMASVGWPILTVRKSWANTQYFTIGTSGVGGLFYRQGSLVAKFINRQTNIKASAVASPGVMDENIRRTNKGEFEAGFVAGTISYDAFHGVGTYSGRPQPNIRGWWADQLGGLFIVVQADSDIRSVGDLKGKRIVFSKPGSAENKWFEDVILRPYGIASQSDYSPMYIGRSEGISAMINRNADAWLFATTAFGSAHFRRIQAQRAIRFIGVDPTVLSPNLKLFPYFTIRELDLSEYTPGVRIPVVTLRFHTIVNANLPDDVVYEVTKALFDNLQEFHEGGKVNRAVTLESATDGIPIPIHPGAARYYAEKGVLKG